MTCGGFDPSDTVSKRSESAVGGRQGERPAATAPCEYRRRPKGRGGSGKVCLPRPSAAVPAALRRRQVEASGVPPPEAVGSMSTDSGYSLLLSRRLAGAERRKCDLAHSFAVTVDLAATVDSSGGAAL
jgi:hypothetical protein